jgi:hypothetical protein
MFRNCYALKSLPDSVFSYVYYNLLD